MNKQAVFAALCFTVITAISTALSQPTLVVDGGLRFSFDRVVKGTVVERTVTLRNNGTDTLTLDRVDASCGCTATVLSEKRIPPGGSGNLQITFNAAGMSGSIYKNVVVNSNAANAPRATIEFSALIVTEVTFTPDDLTFKDARPGTTYTSTLVLRNEGRDTLVVSSYRTKVQGLTLQLPRGPILPGQAVDLVAEFRPKAEVTAIADRLILKTSSRSQPEVIVPVYGSVKVFRFDEVGSPPQ